MSKSMSFLNSTYVRAINETIQWPLDVNSSFCNCSQLMYCVLFSSDSSEPILAAFMYCAMLCVIRLLIRCMSFQNKESVFLVSRFVMESWHQPLNPELCRGICQPAR